MGGGEMSTCFNCGKEDIRVVAVAVYCTESGYLYKQPLYSEREIELVRSSSHPEIYRDARVIIVYGDLSTEDFT
jgi:hypothetical protein